MWKNVLRATALILLGFVIFLLMELQYLAPFRSLIWARLGTGICVFFGFLTINLVALFRYVGPKIFHQETGALGAHLEKELRGSRLLPGLSQRLSAEK